MNNAGKFWLIFLCCAGLAQAQPRLFCELPSFEFAPLDNSQEVNHTFTLSNSGKSTLYIRRVRSDCGCLLVRPAPETIEPGGQIEIKARLILKGLRGSQKRKITVFSNDPQTPQLVLTIAGEVLAPVDLYPERLFWGHIHKSQAAENSFTVDFQGVGSGKITSVSIDNPAFTSTVETVLAAKVYDVTVKAVPPLTPGRFSHNISVTTDHPQFSNLTASMSGRVVESVFAIPDEIILETAEKTGEALVILRSVNNVPFKVLEVIPPQPENKVRILELSSGAVRLDLSNLDLTKDLSGKKLLIKLDCPDLLELSIPLSARNTSR